MRIQSTLRRLRRLRRNLFAKPLMESELAEEIGAYVQMLAEEKTAGGIEPRRAYREAVMELGGIEQVKEQVREARIGNSVEGVYQDIRQALRSLKKNASSTILAVFMAALGISAATVIFSVFYAVLLQPLPFAQPARLVQLWETRQQRGWEKASFMAANFWNLKAQNRAFENVGAFTGTDMNMTGLGNPERLSVGIVSAQFFHILGVNPVIGRDFPANADQPGGQAQVALLSNKFWRSRFEASRSIIGQTLRLDGKPYRVAGVLPPGDPWLNEADVFTPMVYTPDVNNSDGFEFSVVGRLKPEISFAAARSDLKRISQELAGVFPRQDAGMGVKIEPAAAWGADAKLRRALWVLAGAVGFLLLIACVNLANLMLAKAAARSRELMVRSALGASRARITRLVMAESLVVSFLGCGLGLALSFFALDAIQSANVTGIPHLAEAGINGWVLGVAFLTTMFVGMLSGLFPALQVPHRNVAAALREGDRNQTGSRAQNRLRSALVAAEVALSFVLLIGAGLLLRSFEKLTQVDRGFQSENRLAFSVNLPGLPNEGRLEGLLRQFLPRIKALPGVIDAAAVNSEPIVGPDPGMGIVAAQRSESANANVPWASWRFITSGYFRTMGIPLLEGKEFSERDRKIAIRPVVVSKKLAQMLWPGGSSIGRLVNLWKGQGENFGKVIGVVGNVRDHGLDSDPTPIVYLSYYGQSASPVEFIVHTSVPPGSVVAGLRENLTQVDASLPIFGIRSLDDIVDSTLGPKRLNTSLLGVFAGIALLLAMTGIYGVLSYSVARRTAEIGLRVALGAERRRIFGLIVGQGMRPIMVGSAVGLAISVALSRFLLSLLFDVEPTDFATYFTVTVVVTATALISCYFPAHRALRVDPALALHEE